MEGTPMKVEITVKIDGREVETVSSDISGQPMDIEQQTETLKDRLGQVVLAEGFSQFDEQLRRPCCCGKQMHQKGKRTVTLMSQSGEVEFTRRRYRCTECGRCTTPADALVCCGNHRITRHLAKQICHLATLEHFTRMEQLMADQHGVHIGHDDMSQLVHDVGGVLDAQRQATAKHAMEAPSKIASKVAAKASPKQIYVSCDGIMYCTNEREACPDDPEKKRLIWRQMRVGCVYWQDEKEHWHKQIVWGQEDLQTFAASLYQLACECGYKEADEKIFIADGGEWCWGIHQKYFVEASGVLDWYHASEHVWDCGKALHPSSEKVKAWVDEALSQMRTSGGEGLLEWLQPQLSGLRGKKRASLNSLLGYFHTRIGETNYQSYREMDWQIGSGMIESTAKQLVGIRLKGPGMHWSIHGASAITALRAHNLNGNWHTTWKNLVI